ncbi:MAG TPA: MBL fold metallo-hydrolase [Gaiellaceae bacterium]|nr:MBL fold metallo-hydrolase [Gaiellaceae bacterium]
MRATVWGCRGSLATPGAATVRYGGNTSCVEVRLADGTLLVLDAGTGIRPLGLELEDYSAPIHLLLTHLHLDHLEGLGFFMPLWRAGSELHVWGPPSPTRSLEERIARYLSPPLFPIHLSEIPAQLTFHNVPDEPWEIGDARIEAEPVSHPGPTVGYRLEDDGSSLAYIPDHEPALGGDLRALPPEWISGLGVAEAVDVLLHDAQYSEAEYETKVGWGHSSVAAAVDFARAARVERLLLFHHDPLHTDQDLVALEAQARELWGRDGVAPELAVEGATIELAGRVAAASG